MVKTRAALIEELRRDFPSERLFVAMFALLQKWRERAGGGEALEAADVSDRELLLDEFLRSCSVHQLELLREIALKIEGGAQ
jgi:hypothetical protein